MGHFRKNLISLFLNSYCNMRCIYCPVHGQRGFYALQSKILKEGIQAQPVIDIDFAKCGVKNFFEQTGSHQIRLFSNGEATLALDVARDIVDYAYSLGGDDLYVELQSNGYFRENVTDWVIENVHFIWVSLDGPGDIQDQ